MLNGEYVVVEQVQHELLESSEITYNFEVKDFHTYYVGEQGIFAHNMCKKAQIKIPPRVKVEYGKVLRILKIVLRLLVQERIKDSILGTTYTMKLKFFTVLEDILV